MVRVFCVATLRSRRLEIQAIAETKKLRMSGLHLKLPRESERAVPKPFPEHESMPYLPLDQSVPAYVLGRRRHAISGGYRTSSGAESPYGSRPRMKRRGAISYERNDTAAQYIRYLGTRAPSTVLLL